MNKVKEELLQHAKNMKRGSGSKQVAFQANFFFTFFPEIQSHFENTDPHNKKQIRNLVQNKNVSQVESSHKSL